MDVLLCRYYDRGARVRASLQGGTPTTPADAPLTVTTFTSSEAAGLANASLVAGKRDAILVDAVQTRREAGGSQAGSRARTSTSP
ncbi:MAG: hypothetical protein M3Q69_00020 [Acidobacteriota bacterium]|nr:hypothetical protein [Acidobacteriota bacterium]